MKLSKKMLFGLVVLVCFVVVVSGCTSSNNTTGTNTSVIQIRLVQTLRVQTRLSSNDVSVVVKYPGTWAVDVSGTFGFVHYSGTGDQTTSIGDVLNLTAAARKTEGGNGVLTVSITKVEKHSLRKVPLLIWRGYSSCNRD